MTIHVHYQEKTGPDEGPICWDQSSSYNRTAIWEYVTCPECRKRRPAKKCTSDSPYNTPLHTSRDDHGNAIRQQREDAISKTTDRSLQRKDKTMNEETA